MNHSLEFQIKIASSDSDAEDNPKFLICSTLRDVARRIEAGHDIGNVRDTNGNTIGNWYIDIQDKDE